MKEDFELITNLLRDASAYDKTRSYKHDHNMSLLSQVIMIFVLSQ